MSVNFSSSSNASFHPAPPSINIFYFLHKCFNTKVGIFSITAYTITSVLILLPFYIFILYLGHQRRRQQHRPGRTTSHSDLFTYHMVAIELMSVLGFTLCCCGVHTDLPGMTMLGILFFFINLVGQNFFHILTCLEHYVAVVHPIIYLSLRKAIRIRNITIGNIWLLCLAETGVFSVVDSLSVVIIVISGIVIVLIVISFCSLSVLCVLTRPGPGEGGGGRQRVDQSKLRAFYTIMVILGVLLLKFGGNLVTISLFSSAQVEVRCGVWLSLPWCNLPSCLVLPLLFLQRAGKLRCCKNNNGSGHGSG